MHALSLATGLLRVSIAPELGAGIADFSIKGPTGYFYPLMRRAAPGETNASLLGSFVMAPWANRISGAKFAWNGREHGLNPNTADAMAQHGDVRKRPWRVTEHTPSSATMEIDSRACAPDAQFNWPWACVCRQRVSVEFESDRTGALVIELSVENADREAFPVGCGLHPYFMRRLWDDRDLIEVQAECQGRYPLERGCANGPMRREPLTELLSRGGALPDEHIDAVLGGFSGRATLTWPFSAVRLTMQTSANMNHLVVFAPHASSDYSSPLSFVAIEPQSHVNDALNIAASGGVDAARAGVRVISPGERLETRTEFRIDRR